MLLSRRIEMLKPSSTLAVMNRAKQMQAQGINVLGFTLGEPDFDTPESIKKAACDDMMRGDTKYAPVAGDPATRKVIAEKMARENHIPGVTADHVVVSAGAKQCLYNLMQCLIDPPAPGEQPWEVLLPVPAWLSFAPQAQLAGGRVVELPTTPESDFKITPEQLRRAITPRSRAFIINSPNNPCGTMYSEAEIRALAAVIDQAARTVAPHLWIISDEMYERITFGPIGHFSIGSIPEVAQRTVTVNALSKSYAMTGWRAGYMAGAGEWGLKIAAACAKLQGQCTTSIPPFIMAAVRHAIQNCDADVERMRIAFAQRGELIHGLASRIPGLRCAKPTGAYYLFPDVSSCFGKTSPAGAKITGAASFAEAFLNEHHVAVVPGEDFGSGGEKCVRFTFSCGDEQIREGIRRLGEFMASLR